VVQVFSERSNEASQYTLQTVVFVPGKIARSNQVTWRSPRRNLAETFLGGRTVAKKKKAAKKAPKKRAKKSKKKK
jgi:hypothetical protein